MFPKKIVQWGIFSVSFLILCNLSFLTLFFARQIKNTRQVSHTDNQQIEVNHVLIAGTEIDKDMLNKFYEGAHSIAGEYNSVVEKLLPSSLAETKELQSWVDYASYVDADGLILFCDDENTIIKQPVNAYGSTIPVVTLLNNNPDTNQVCFLGTNKYELGKAFASEVFVFEKNTEIKVHNILALVDIEKNVTAVDRILSSLQEELKSRKGNEIINIYIEHIVNKNFSGIDANTRNIIQNAVENYNTELILCFSADETISAAQTLIDLNLTANSSVIGLYENSKTQSYIDKGIIFSVISVDAYSIGIEAMKNLFLWKTKGYTNSYSTTDLVMLRKEEHL